MENMNMRKGFFGFILLCFFTLTLASHAQNALDDSGTSSDDTCADSSFGCSQSSPSESRDTTNTTGSRAVFSSQQRQQQRSSSNEASTLVSPEQSRIFSQQLPPTKPSEFQKFVSATTRQKLEIYGARLFRRDPISFTPSNLTPASANYVIGPDDELRVRIWGAINYSGNLRVDRSGNVYLPQIGLVQVGGLRFTELDAHLRAATARVYRNFDLSADLGRIRSIQVYITGQANKPGVYTVSALSSLVNALFASGGPSSQGSLRHIQLKRNGSLVTDFDLYAFLLHGDKSKDVPLQPEDVLYIPPVGPQTAIFGSIRTPAIYELREGDTLGDLLEYAGGTSALSAQAKVSLDRADQNVRRATEFALNKSGLSVHLADSDIVRVYSILPAYQRTVTLRGSIANAGRYGWHDGMRLSDLIPDREALMSRDYWWKRSHLGLPEPDYDPETTPRARNTDATSNQATNPDIMNDEQSRTGTAANSNSGPASLAVQNQMASGSDSDSNSEVNSNFNSDSDVNSNSNIAPDSTSGTAQSKPVRPKNTVRIVAPEPDWNYAVIERVDPQTMKTSLLPFDLGKLVLQHDSSQDFVLQPNDAVTIFSQDDIHVPQEQQTKYITLEGEIAHAGTYSVLPGETLRDVVNRAGGLTPKAYLYGSEFDRESTRILQQQRIDEYVRSLELETSRSTIAFSNYAALSGQAGGTSAPNQTVQTEFLNQLRKIRATGRVVFNIPPQSRLVDDLPAIALENKDRFIVPSLPATINIVGAVYDQSTFLFQTQGTVGKYLEMAGGTNRSADTKKTYIIRADGSVFNRTATKGYWGDAFQHAKLNPGDTIVVPDKNFRPNLGLKSTLEWTQMFTQLAMGAATISLLN
jgi:protein involved in polysaccharide export with SLBB domain